MKSCWVGGDGARWSLLVVGPFGFYLAPEKVAHTAQHTALCATAFPGYYVVCRTGTLT